MFRLTDKFVADIIRTIRVDLGLGLIFETYDMSDLNILYAIAGNENFYRPDPILKEALMNHEIADES